MQMHVHVDVLGTTSVAFARGLEGDGRALKLEQVGGKVCKSTLQVHGSSSLAYRLPS